MKRHYLSLLTAALMLLVPELSDAQIKFYTKKARMDDFTTKTTKVVASGQSMLAGIVQEEIESRWRISPYEFCNDAEHEALSGSNDYYFLYLTKEGGIVFLNLSKGGNKDDADNKAKPFDVVRVPIATESYDGLKDARFTGYAIDAIQSFAEQCMTSDQVGYKGLKAFNNKKLEGRKVILDEDRAYQALEEGVPETLAGIVIAPGEIGFDSKCYKILITTDTHEILYFNESSYKTPSDKKFTEKEKDAINRRNGNIL